MKYNKEGLTLANSKEFQKLEEYDQVIDLLKDVLQKLEKEKDDLFYAMQREKEELGSPTLESVKRFCELVDMMRSMC